LRRERDRFQALELVLERQAVAALRLDRGRAEREEAIEVQHQALRELFLRRRTHAARRRQDPAAFGRDLGVGRAARAQLELVLARGGEHRMRVRVDETRTSVPPRASSVRLARKRRASSGAVPSATMRASRMASAPSFKTCTSPSCLPPRGAFPIGVASSLEPATIRSTSSSCGMKRREGAPC
jgi:hypothetical protein